MTSSLCASALQNPRRPRALPYRRHQAELSGFRHRCRHPSFRKRMPGSVAFGLPLAALSLRRARPGAAREKAFPLNMCTPPPPTHAGIWGQNVPGRRFRKTIIRQSRSKTPATPATPTSAFRFTYQECIQIYRRTGTRYVGIIFSCLLGIFTYTSIASSVFSVRLWPTDLYGTRYVVPLASKVYDILSRKQGKSPLTGSADVGLKDDTQTSPFMNGIIVYLWCQPADMGHRVRCKLTILHTTSLWCDQHSTCGTCIRVVHKAVECRLCIRTEQGAKRYSYQCRTSAVYYEQGSIKYVCEHPGATLHLLPRY